MRELALTLSIAALLLGAPVLLEPRSRATVFLIWINRLLFGGQT